MKVNIPNKLQLDSRDLRKASAIAKGATIESAEIDLRIYQPVAILHKGAAVIPPHREWEVDEMQDWELVVSFQHKESGELDLLPFDAVSLAPVGV